MCKTVDAFRIPQKIQFFHVKILKCENKVDLRFTVSRKIIWHEYKTKIELKTDKNYVLHQKTTLYTYTIQYIKKVYIV